MLLAPRAAAYQIAPHPSSGYRHLAPPCWRCPSHRAGQVSIVYRAARPVRTSDNPTCIGCVLAVYYGLPWLHLCRYQGREGGYTRVMRGDKRAGDNAQMAVIECVCWLRCSVCAF